MSRLDEIRTSGRIEELGRTECVELLRAKSVGRVGFVGPDGPLVLPVNYVMDGETVLFRTSPYNVMGSALRKAPAAFEVDDLDDYLQSGWSVLVQGSAGFVVDDEEAEITHERLTRPEPWAAGTRTLYIRVTAQTISGRRLHPV
ncbi:MAG: pyridoxamine 5'-phosphate oxidase family protein [Nocardioidaceae bacterium]